MGNSHLTPINSLKLMDNKDESLSSARKVIELQNSININYKPSHNDNQIDQFEWNVLAI